MESDEIFKKRIILWNWIVACLQKGNEKIPFSCLFDDININTYDVAVLFTGIIATVDIQNPFYFGHILPILSMQSQKAMKTFSLSSLA